MFGLFMTGTVAFRKANAPIIRMVTNALYQCLVFKFCGTVHMDLYQNTQGMIFYIVYYNLNITNILVSLKPNNLF